MDAALTTFLMHLNLSALEEPMIFFVFILKL